MLCCDWPAGDVLQLPLPLCGANLLPGESPPTERFCGRHHPHVHPQGEGQIPPAGCVMYMLMHTICKPYAESLSHGQ